MSSSYDSGRYADQASEAKESPCNKSATYQHMWIVKGTWPSLWEQCTLCDKTLYWK